MGQRILAKALEDYQIDHSAQTMPHSPKSDPLELAKNAVLIEDNGQQRPNYYTNAALSDHNYDTIDR